MFDLDDDSKMTPERERYQKNKKPWIRVSKVVVVGATLNGVSPFTTVKYTYNKGMGAWNSSNTHETKDNKDLKENHLN